MIYQYKHEATESPRLLNSQTIVAVQWSTAFCPLSLVHMYSWHGMWIACTVTCERMYTHLVWKSTDDRCSFTCPNIINFSGPCTTSHMLTFSLRPKELRWGNKQTEKRPETKSFKPSWAWRLVHYQILSLQASSLQGI